MVTERTERGAAFGVALRGQAQSDARRGVLANGARAWDRGTVSGSVIAADDRGRRARMARRDEGASSWHVIEKQRSRPESGRSFFHFASGPRRYSALAGLGVFTLAGKGVLSRNEPATRLRWQQLSRGKRSELPAKAKNGAHLPVTACRQRGTEQPLSRSPLPEAAIDTVTVSIAAAHGADLDSRCLD
jgi:hypothetical protein